jgi:RNase P subunit RPR2
MHIDRYIDLILAVGISLGFIIWLVIMSKRKSKYGLNFKRVYCPVCGTKQPIVRIPKNQNQILYGGNTCSKCQAELDKYGNVAS